MIDDDSHTFRTLKVTGVKWLITLCLAKPALFLVVLLSNIVKVFLFHSRSFYREKYRQKPLSVICHCSLNQLFLTTVLINRFYPTQCLVKLSIEPTDENNDFLKY